WIIEVANTSLQKDVDIKAAIYAEAGIPEYWVLNLAAKNIIVFREPENGKYLSEQTIEKGVIIPLAFVDVQVSVERLLG
ncbi:MAG: Uma2 family endonuclease, partial [Sphaerospermopsis kisseleviana]